MPPPFTGDVRTVRRPDYVPRSKRPCFDLYKVEPGKEHRLILASKQLECVLVHAVDGRTLPCTGDGQTCWLSHAEFGTRWQAWAFCYVPYKSGFRLVTLTPNTVTLIPQLLDPAEDLSGREIRLWRADTRIRSRLMGAVDWSKRYPCNGHTLPDLLDQLGSLWAAPDRPENWRKATRDVQQLREQFTNQKGGAK